MPFILSDRERQILDSIADTILPEGGKISFSALELGTTRKIEEICTHLPHEAQKGLKFFIHLINLLPLFTSFKTFIKLDETKKREFFEKLENSKILTFRNIAISIKGLIFLVYYNSPEVQNIIGYKPECLKE